MTIQNPDVPKVETRKRTENTFSMHENCSECNPAQLSCGFCVGGKFSDGKVKPCFKAGKSVFPRDNKKKR